ncbi:peroxisomal targeting signal 2 receptor-like isoform X2 [Panulirus ornatus]|uniref:peroxisomal targeting signal 2 receptor-like isoform X2 n=1 Tax=Panulirus ornatus TaxID=150431 RepID=UPI003A89A40F
MFIATAGTDGAIHDWDSGQPGQAALNLEGHGYPVRRVKFSPFIETQLSSMSYDYTTRIGDHKLPSPCLKEYLKQSKNPLSLIDAICR